MCLLQVFINAPLTDKTRCIILAALHAAGRACLAVQLLPLPMHALSQALKGCDDVSEGQSSACTGTVPTRKLKQSGHACAGPGGMFNKDVIGK